VPDVRAIGSEAAQAVRAPLAERGLDRLAFRSRPPLAPRANRVRVAHFVRASNCARAAVVRSDGAAEERGTNNTAGKRDSGSEAARGPEYHRRVRVSDLPLPHSSSRYSASWKITPNVKRSPDSMGLTPCR
jgi:hypothetical protein